MQKVSQGAALITAIFIMAITATIAMALLVNQRQLIQQTELIVGHDQLYEAASGLRLWAQGKMILYLNAVHRPKPTLAAFVVPTVYTGPSQFDQVQLTGRFVDQQGLFNLNTLVMTANIPRFVRLIRAISPITPLAQAKTIAINTAAWLQKDSHDDDYLRLTPPYRAGHQQLADVSELRLIVGMTSALYQRLRPYITAYPVGTSSSSTSGGSTQDGSAININTAPAPVLVTLSPVIDLGKAQALWDCRKQHGVFATAEAYDTNCVMPTLGGRVQLTGITTISQHMLFIGQARQGRQSVTTTSLLTGVLSQLSQPPTWTVRTLWQAL